MDVVWTRHSRQRFFERSLKYGITADEAEQGIKAQKVIERQKDGTIKTIFMIAGNFFTVVKEETKKLITIISIWESNEMEVNLWKRKK